ncbi:MAG: hypothetical protein NC489_19350 [Ruminococcus flavefaciens]|nr:hypothetical protein [Ruminococcus flavefaciens]
MKEKIKQIVQSAINEINEDLETSEQIMYAENSSLFGLEKGIDSFSFVSLISNIEDQIGDVFSQEIFLVNDKVLSGKENPFATVGSLENYISTLLEENN